MENVSQDLLYISRARLHRKRANVIQTLKTVEALAKIGVRVRLFIPPWKGGSTLQDELDRMGIKVPLEVSPTTWLKSHWKSVGFAPFLWTHKKMIQQARTVYTRSVPISKALAERNILHSLEIHDVEALVEGNTLQSVIQAHQKGCIGHLFPISRAAAEWLVGEGADPDRIHVCPCGVDWELFQSVKPFDPRHLATPRIMYVGRISRDRGLRILERLASLPSCRVTVVGEIQDRPKHPNIRILPFVPHKEIPRLLEQADILIMPYQRNLPHAASISPMKLFEAMAAGRPIVISNLKPIQEIIRHGENGICVEPDDPEAWVEAVETLQADSRLAAHLADKARKDARKYTWENRARTIAHVLLQQK